MAIETPSPTQVGGIVLFVQIGALEVENVNQIKYEGTPHFPVTASSAKIGFWKVNLKPLEGEVP